MNGCVEPETPPDSPSMDAGVGNGKPPRHHLTSIRHCSSSARIAAAASSSRFGLDLGTVSLISPTDVRPGFLPVFRSGSCADIGPKSYMEDEHVCVDNLIEHLGGRAAGIPAPGAFYGVFDGHGGVDAACFVQKNILKFIMEDIHFPNNIEKAIRSAFLKADHALADSHSLDQNSGTTALMALIFGRTMFVANAGDCRAVLGKRGRAVELSRDHKPNCKSEKIRIENLGGTVFDGYLNGQLAVARALGDWHMKGPKGSISPLSAEPELQEVILTEEDEFLIIGCDGLWDVMSSQCAVTIVRKELMSHNDPERCSSELVQEALKRNSCDNLTVVVICFSSNPPPQIEIPRYRVRRSISMEGLHVLRGALDRGHGDIPESHATERAGAESLCHGGDAETIQQPRTLHGQSISRPGRLRLHRRRLLLVERHPPQLRDPLLVVVGSVSGAAGAPREAKKEAADITVTVASATSLPQVASHGVLDLPSRRWTGSQAGKREMERLGGGDGSGGASRRSRGSGDAGRQRIL